MSSMTVRSRKFCCCLPVRFGVIILSLLAMVGGSFVAGFGFIQIASIPVRPIEKSDEIALWIQSIMYMILGIVGVVGFIGALIKRRSMVSSFAIVLAIHLGLSIASGAFSIYTMFSRDSSLAVDQCVTSATAQGVNVNETDCRNSLALMKGVMVGVYVITWLIQLYAYFIVERYADQLEEEEMSKHTIVVPRSLPEISAPQMASFNHGYGSPAYPFSEPQQSFGAGRGRDQSNMV